MAITLGFESDLRSQWDFLDDAEPNRVFFLAFVYVHTLGKLVRLCFQPSNLNQKFPFLTLRNSHEVVFRGGANFFIKQVPVYGVNLQ